MAWLSKTTPFEIYNDRPPSEPEKAPSDDWKKQGTGLQKLEDWTDIRQHDGFITESEDESAKIDSRANDGDDEKNYTRTSISSMPESAYPTDCERTPMRTAYNSMYERQSPRRTDSSGRGYFGSPLSKGSARESGMRRARLAGTSHPRHRRYDEERNAEKDDAKQRPLVLLHVTILPVTFPWSMRSMQEVLPEHIFDNMHLLKAKLSETVMRRGVLIQHPGDDYELLEEKLLEALELKTPRISKCGHFRARDSTSSSASVGSEGSDSALGSSVDGAEDNEICNACHHHLKAAGSGKQKWSIRVFAANGLMRASTWSTVWNEMERVDVEIMPYIKDSLKIKLDRIKQDSESLSAEDVVSADKIDELVIERLRSIEEAARVEEMELARSMELLPIEWHVSNEPAMADAETSTAREQPVEARHDHEPEREQAPKPPQDLPSVYRVKDIPVSVLLCNYVLILAQDRRNVAVFFALLGALALAMNPGLWSSLSFTNVQRSAHAGQTTTPAELLPDLAQSLPAWDHGGEAMSNVGHQNSYTSGEGVVADDIMGSTTQAAPSPSESIGFTLDDDHGASSKLELAYQRDQDAGQGQCPLAVHTYVTLMQDYCASLEPAEWVSSTER